MTDTVEHQQFIPKTQCYGCRQMFDDDYIEYHHYPVPRRCGGKRVEPLCYACHTMVDRIDMSRWPHSIAIDAMEGAPTAVRLLIMKVMSQSWHDFGLPFWPKKGVMPFGYQLSADQMDIIENREEQRIIALVKHLQKKKVSFDQIAAHIEQMNPEQEDL